MVYIRLIFVDTKVRIKINGLTNVSTVNETFLQIIRKIDGKFLIIKQDNAQMHRV